MRLAWVLLAIVSIAAAARRADACPCCDPCHKYDREMLPPPEVLADQYVAERAVPLSVHPKRAEVMKILTAVRFVPAAKGARKLRVVDGAHVPAQIDHGDGARLEIVHDLAARRGHFQLTLAGASYLVEPCTDAAHHATTCLTRVSDPAPAP